MRVFLAPVGQCIIGVDPTVQPVERFLASFTSIKMTGQKILADVASVGASEYCVDSGAHVWLSAFHKNGDRPPVEKAEAWIQAFLTALEGLSPPPAFVVELDLQALYGLDVVQAWRRNIWAPFERRTGIAVCYVWHSVDEERVWNDMLSSADIGFVGLANRDKIEQKTRARMVFDAYKVGKRVHGFAATNGRVLRDVPYYSVDSTSWGSAFIFGYLYKFDARTGRMKNYCIGTGAQKLGPAKTVEAFVRAKSGITIPGGRVDSVDRREKVDYAIKQFGEFERWFTRYWQLRGVDWDARLSRP